MNGASASTAVANMSSSPVMHRKTASGMSQRLPESLCHNPRASCAVDPNVLPNTISPRRVLPRVLITQPPLLFCLLEFLPSPRCASSLESLPRPEHRSCNAGMSSTLQPPDWQSALPPD